MAGGLPRTCRMSELDLGVLGPYHSPISKVAESDRSSPLESVRGSAKAALELEASLGDLTHLTWEPWTRPVASSETPRYCNRKKPDWTAGLTTRFGVPLYVWHRRIGPIADDQAVRVPYGTCTAVTLYSRRYSRRTRLRSSRL